MTANHSLGEDMADKHDPAPKLDVDAVNRALQEDEQVP